MCGSWPCSRDSFSWLSHTFVGTEACVAAKFFHCMIQEKIQRHFSLENGEVVSSKIATVFHGSRMWAHSPKKTSPAPALHPLNRGALGVFSHQPALPGQTLCPSHVTFEGTLSSFPGTHFKKDENLVLPHRKPLISESRRSCRRLNPSSRPSPPTPYQGWTLLTLLRPPKHGVPRGARLPLSGHVASV